MNAHASVVERSLGPGDHVLVSRGLERRRLVGAALGGLLISRGATAPVQLGVESAITFAIAVRGELPDRCWRYAIRQAPSLRCPNGG